jgi:phosphate-selective porin OprO/OprP
MRSGNTINLPLGRACGYIETVLLILLMSACISPLYAFTFETKGSPKIRSDDGNFEMTFGARAHLDVHSFDNDKANPAYPAFGSQLPDGNPHSGTRLP